MMPSTVRFCMSGLVLTSNFRSHAGSLRQRSYARPNDRTAYRGMMWRPQLTLAARLTQASGAAILAFRVRTMEGHSIHSKSAPAGGKRAVIVASWEAAGKPPVDARLLKSILAGLQSEFENDKPDGPAAIARVLADAGAELRHPEIIDADAEWRQARLESEANESGLELIAAQVMTLASAETFILKLEDLRQQGRDADQRA